METNKKMDDDVIETDANWQPKWNWEFSSCSEDEDEETLVKTEPDDTTAFTASPIRIDSPRPDQQQPNMQETEQLPPPLEVPRLPVSDDQLCDEGEQCRVREYIRFFDRKASSMQPSQIGKYNHHACCSSTVSTLVRTQLFETDERGWFSDLKSPGSLVREGEWKTFYVNRHAIQADKEFKIALKGHIEKRHNDCFIMDKWYFGNPIALSYGRGLLKSGNKSGSRDFVLFVEKSKISFKDGKHIYSGETQIQQRPVQEGAYVEINDAHDNDDQFNIDDDQFIQDLHNEVEIVRREQTPLAPPAYVPPENPAPVQRENSPLPVEVPVPAAVEAEEHEEPAPLVRHQIAPRKRRAVSASVEPDEDDLDKNDIQGHLQRYLDKFHAMRNDEGCSPSIIEINYEENVKDTTYKVLCPNPRNWRKKERALKQLNDEPLPVAKWTLINMVQKLAKTSGEWTNFNKKKFIPWLKSQEDCPYALVGSNKLTLGTLSFYQPILIRKDCLTLGEDGKYTFHLPNDDPEPEPQSESDKIFSEVCSENISTNTSEHTNTNSGNVSEDSEEL